MEIIDTRESFLKMIPKNCVIAELGVFKGEFSRSILEISDPKTLFLVDIFEGLMSSGDKDGQNIIEINLDDAYRDLLTMYSDNSKIKIVKSTTEHFLLNVENEFLDVIYIDADHSFAGVKKDLDLSIQKVKRGGFIMGHDYTSSMFPGVVQAVDQFCFENGLVINYITKDGCPSFMIRNGR